MSRNQISGGFDAHFVQPLDNRHKCSKCNLALREPHQTICGHRICLSCLHILREKSSGHNRQPVCPIDGVIIDNTFPDRFASREVLSLEVFCQYRENGCHWKNELRQYEEHISVCDCGDANCPNPGCSERLQRRQLPLHLRERCLFRVIQCEYCSSGVVYCMLDEHQEKDCPEILCSCKNNCGMTAIPRYKLNQHYSKECPKAEGSCPFSFAGCNFKGTNTKINDHLKEFLHDHIHLAAEQTETLESNCTSLSKRLDKESAKVRSLEAKLAEIGESLTVTRNEFLTVQSKIESIEEQLENVTKNNRQLDEKLTFVERSSLSDVTQEIETFKLLACQNDEKIKQLEKQVKESSQFSFEGIDLGFGPLSLPVSSNPPGNVEKRVERVENQLALQDVHLAEANLKLQLMESTSYNGTLIWKIDNVMRRRHDAITGKTPSLYSPPFYTSRFGHKMCARVYLNGDGMGKGSHISLFFVLMRSEWDALLSFPFQQKITMKLLDLEGDKHISESFRPDPHSSSFRRPMTDMNTASGCPLFAAHDTLLNGSYTREDSMYIVISVDTSNLPTVPTLGKNKTESPSTATRVRGKGGKQRV